jgi:hypothetical protein
LDDSTRCWKYNGKTNGKTKNISIVLHFPSFSNNGIYFSSIKPLLVTVPKLPFPNTSVVSLFDIVSNPGNNDPVDVSLL